MSAPVAGQGLSLQRQLLLWLLLPQLVLWLVGGVLAYRIALSYAEKGIDQSLTQSVLSLARQVKPVGSGLLIDFPRAAQDIIEQDPKDRVSYTVSSPPGKFLLGNGLLPGPFNTDRIRGTTKAVAEKTGRSFEDAMADVGKSNPTGRIGDPAEFGDACAFLCSASAGFIVGQNLVMDGGSFNSSMG